MNVWFLNSKDVAISSDLRSFSLTESPRAFSDSYDRRLNYTNLRLSKSRNINENDLKIGNRYVDVIYMVKYLWV